jgi:hypothetical protein
VVEHESSWIAGSQASLFNAPAAAIAKSQFLNQAVDEGGKAGDLSAALCVRSECKCD